MKLVALHGHTGNGATMRGALAGLQRALPSLEIVAPDAPHTCADDAVERLYAVWKVPRLAPPFCMWWDASADGREYRGWDETRELLRTVIGAGDEPVGILGFSQGAIVAAALAAIAEHGEMPPVAFVILVAGRPPRADAITPFLGRPIAVPSLHVWGERDTLVGDTSRALVELFSAETREVATWPGEHVIPSSGAAADAIVDFIARR